MEIENSQLDLEHTRQKFEKVELKSEQYAETRKIIPPQSLEDLIQELHKVFSQDTVNVEYVKTLMTLYKSKPKEWKKFAKWDTHRYTRNLVDEGNGKFNLMILCWNEAQGSSIHSHANSHCFLKVMDGSVREELYDWPSESEDESEMQPRTISTAQKDQCVYINDDIGLHRVENPSHSDKAVTLHLYSPPFDSCNAFDQKTGHSNTVGVTFWSKFGRRTPFGRACDADSVPAEDN